MRVSGISGGAGVKSQINLNQAAVTSRFSEVAGFGGEGTPGGNLNDRGVSVHPCYAENEAGGGQEAAAGGFNRNGGFGAASPILGERCTGRFAVTGFCHVDTGVVAAPDSGLAGIAGQAVVTLYSGAFSDRRMRAVGALSGSDYFSLKAAFFKVPVIICDAP